LLFFLPAAFDVVFIASLFHEGTDRFTVIAFAGTEMLRVFKVRHGVQKRHGIEYLFHLFYIMHIGSRYCWPDGLYLREEDFNLIQQDKL
jgi:hypothetical protein